MTIVLKNYNSQFWQDRRIRESLTYSVNIISLAILENIVGAHK